MKKNLKLYDKIALYLNVFIIILMITCSNAGAVSVKVPLKDILQVENIRLGRNQLQYGFL